jgi:hypothetical protein
VRERALCFGSHGGLVGILTEPDGATRPGAPAVLLFNVGLGHRVGPGRLNVDLARRLARSGTVTLRFDLSGLGDSEARDDARSDGERAVADLREAMDLVQRRTGVDGFVAVGHCSGVDVAHAAALADARVRGAVFIDGYAYPTAGYRLRLLLEKVRGLARARRWEQRWARWRRKLGLGVAAGDAGTRAAEPIFDRTYPPREQFRADLERLLARPARLLFVYSADAWFYNHAAQFASMVGWRALPAGLEVERWPAADHVFRAVAERARLVEQLAGWVERAFAAGPGAAT